MLQDVHYSIVCKSDILEPTNKVMPHPDSVEHSRDIRVFE